MTSRFLLFQELGLNNPPENLKDNIVFWIGNNYLKLDMHDDAIKQFQTVLDPVFLTATKRMIPATCWVCAIRKKATPEGLWMPWKSR